MSTQPPVPGSTPTPPIIAQSRPAPAPPAAPPSAPAAAEARLANLHKEGYRICPSCGGIVYPRSITPGSIALELVLWLLLILPGLIYSIWRLTARYYGCSVCGSREVISLFTPRGRALLRQYHNL